MTDQPTKRDQLVGLGILAALIPITLFAAACAVRAFELAAELFRLFAHFLGA